MSARSWRRSWWVVLLLGLAIQTWFWRRSIWIYLDQVDLYELGMAWARDGRLLPFGKLSTGGLPIPGVLLELLVGLPLSIWLDMRASTLVLLVVHLAAALVLSRTLVGDQGWRLAAVFLAVFWLSPWRLFHSAFLWETNYLLLPAAVHLAACRASRSRAAPLASTLLGATLALTFQLHGSALILLLASAYLLYRRQLRLHWPALGLGALLGSLTLWPTARALLGGAGLPVRPDTAAGLLVRLNSVEKGLLYWLRLPSLDVGRRFRQSVYCIEPGSGDVVPRPVLCQLLEVTQILALVSVLLVLVASWWFLRRRPVSAEASRVAESTAWYREYTLAILLATVVACLASPVLIQGWHVLIALPASCLPVAFWMVHRWPTAGAAVRALILLFVIWRLPASLLLLGHPMYAEPASAELPRHVAPLELRVLVPGEE